MKLDALPSPTTDTSPGFSEPPEAGEAAPKAGRISCLSDILDPHVDISELQFTSEPPANQPSDCIEQIRALCSDYVFVRNALTKPFYFQKSNAKVLNKEAFARDLTSLMPLKPSGKPMDPLAADRDHGICEVVDGVGYRPITGQPIYTDSEQVTYANAYRCPQHPEHSGQMVAEVGRILAKHMTYLFGDDDSDQSGAILLAYLAHIVQSPSKPPLWAVLLFGEALGTGKTLMLEIIRNAIGGSNFKNFDGNALKEVFTSLGAFGLLHVIEEIHLNGTSRWSLINDLKPRITNSTVKVRKMHQDAFDQERYARIIATSNYPDALPVTEADRRWCVLQTYGFETTDQVNAFKQTDQGTTHFAELARLKEEEWGGAVLEYFQNFQINAAVFNPHLPPVTAAKRRMAHASRSDNTFIMLEAIEAHGRADITTDSVLNITRLKKLVAESNQKATSNDEYITLPTRKELGYALAALGFRSSPVAFDYKCKKGSKVRAKGRCFIQRKLANDPKQFEQAFIAAEQGIAEVPAEIGAEDVSEAQESISFLQPEDVF